MEGIAASTSSAMAPNNKWPRAALRNFAQSGLQVRLEKVFLYYTTNICYRV